MTASLRRHWGLRSDLVFLNHGSFGACPTPVLAKQQAFREQLEADPVSFMVRELPQLHEASREALAGFLDARPQDVVLVPNATSGVNAVLRSFDWQPGDQILLTNHAYNACANTIRYVAERYQLDVVVASVPFPLVGLDAADAEDAICSAILSCVTDRTRLALIDHIASATALVFPIARLVKELSAEGVETLIDGAHAPGMVPLSLSTLGATYYTGNAHKWLCAPKGTAFLWVDPSKQEQVLPTVISHGMNEPTHRHSRFASMFDWTGTFDPTAWCCLPFVLEWLAAQHEEGWPGIMAHNRELVLRGRALICDTLGVPPAVPDELTGSIATISLPSVEASGPVSSTYIDPLLATLYETHAIQVPIFFWPHAPIRWVRISAYLYNHIEEYEQLAQAIVEHV